MSKISLEKFIEKTKGTRVDVPWVNKPSNLKGQCVSLIQTYIQDCLEQPAKARGHAKTWRTSYVNEGLGTIVTEPRKGDLLVYDERQGGGYGHIAIYLDKNRMYDQNNSTHDNGCAGYSTIFKNYVILRPNASLIEDVIAEEPKPTPTPEPIPAPTQNTLKVGDKVKIIGTGNGSSLGTSNTAYGIGWERQILKIWEGRLYPYQVGNSTGTTGFYKKEALQKI